MELTQVRQKTRMQLTITDNIAEKVNTNSEHFVMDDRPFEALWLKQLEYEVLRYLTRSTQCHTHTWLATACISCGYVLEER